MSCLPYLPRDGIPRGAWPPAHLCSVIPSYDWRTVHGGFSKGWALGLSHMLLLPAQAVLRDAGVLDQLLAQLGAHLSPLLDSEYIAAAAFVPFLEGLVVPDKPELAHTLRVAAGLLKSMLTPAQVPVLAHTSSLDSNRQVTLHIFYHPWWSWK